MVWLATGALATENRSDLRLRVFVLSISDLPHLSTFPPPPSISLAKSFRNFLGGSLKVVSQAASSRGFAPWCVSPPHPDLALPRSLSDTKVTSQVDSLFYMFLSLCVFFSNFLVFCSQWSFCVVALVAPCHIILRYYRCDTPHRAIRFREVSAPPPLLYLV